MSEYRVKRRNSNELMHAEHKYIKREKVKGQWRYYYEDDIKAEKEAQQQARQSKTDKYGRTEQPNNPIRAKLLGTDGARNEKFAANPTSKAKETQQEQLPKLSKEETVNLFLNDDSLDKVTKAVILDALEECDYDLEKLAKEMEEWEKKRKKADEEINKALPQYKNKR